MAKTAAEEKAQNLRMICRAIRATILMNIQSWGLPDADKVEDDGPKLGCKDGGDVRGSGPGPEGGTEPEDEVQLAEEGSGLSLVLPDEEDGLGSPVSGRAEEWTETVDEEEATEPEA